MKYFLILGYLLLGTSTALAQNNNAAPLLTWMRSLPDPSTALPVSFKATDPEKAYRQTGEASEPGPILERMMLRQGISIYDAAVWQIALASTQDPRDLVMAAGPVDTYWKGRINDLANIRGGAPTFVYAAALPNEVSGDLADTGKKEEC